MNGLDPASFLADYWQQKPLLLRSAVPAFSDPLTPEELARAVRIAHAIYTPDEIRLLGGLGTLLASHTDSLVRLVNNSLTRVANSGWALRTGDDPFYAASGAAAFAGSASG